MKSILQNMLSVLAELVLHKYNPIVIGVTGSVGKTATRMAIFAVLKTKFRVRTAEKNYNNEIGLPLTILGIPHYGRDIFGWISGFIHAFGFIVWKNEYPEILILEYGIDHPGDMDVLLSIARPTIGVVTAIGKIPVHVEFFKSADELASEKAKLIAALPKDGWAVLNQDDDAIMGMKKGSHARVTTFGASANADTKFAKFEAGFTDKMGMADYSSGLAFELSNGGDTVGVSVKNCFGKSIAYAVSAASAVGMKLGMNLQETVDALARFDPPPGRLRLLEGIKSSYILDDSYNAAPESVRLALETLKNLPGKRRIAVLGDMLELGSYTEHAHREVGALVSTCADVFLAVGMKMRFAQEEAKRNGMAPENIIHFDSALDVGKSFVSQIQPGDLILVKGSQGIRMERVTEAIMAEPARAGELLVRQDTWWKRNN